MKENKEFDQFAEKLTQRILELMNEFEKKIANKHGLAIFDINDRLQYISDALKNENINLGNETLETLINTIEEHLNNDEES
jgi:hypothetical protein